MIDLKTGTGTILLVDDEEIITDVGKEMIQRLGYRVLIAKNGMEAVEIYRDHWQETVLVILDMRMPGIGSEEIYDRLAAANPAVKVLLATGLNDDEIVNALLERGCKGILTKPFNIQQLSEKIHEVIST